MADFRTHITASTVAGFGVAGAGLWFGVPADSCLLAGAICSVSGMLPDIDSDYGVPLRESLAFGAAAVPMLTRDRLLEWGVPTETIILIGVMQYLTVRFGFGQILRRWTIHRGMWHSIPACLIVMMLIYLLGSGRTPEIRIYKAFAGALGFMVHLLLDEFYSFEVGPRSIRVKRSFGTAIKFLGRGPWANLTTYSILVALGYFVLRDPSVAYRYLHRSEGSQLIADSESGPLPQGSASSAWSIGWPSEGQGNGSVASQEAPAPGTSWPAFWPDAGPSTVSPAPAVMGPRTAPSLSEGQSLAFPASPALPSSPPGGMTPSRPASSSPVEALRGQVAWPEPSRNSTPTTSAPPLDPFAGWSAPTSSPAPTWTPTPGWPGAASPTLVRPSSSVVGPAPAMPAVQKIPNPPGATTTDPFSGWR